MPAIEIAAFVSPRSMPRKLGRTAKVGMSVMPDIWERDAVRDPALTCPFPLAGRGTGWGLQPLFVEQTGGNPMRLQLGIMAEHAARSKNATFVQSERRCLQGGGLKPQQRFPGGPRFLFEAGDQRLADAPPARRRAGVH